jgi:hypothetical protein
VKSFVTSRRRALAFLGSAPLAARAVAEATIGRLAGIATDGIGNASMGLPIGGAPQQAPGTGADGAGQYVPYEKRLIAASDLARLTGIPKAVEFQLRDQAKYVSFLDPDIASKRSWSMNVKVGAQRQRNYERAIERIHAGAAHQRGLALIKSALGFDWPW